MTLKDLLKKCDDTYGQMDYKRLIELCDCVLKIDSQNPVAISYMGISYCFLNQPERALEILKWGLEFYPDNYYMKNNMAMAYYDLGMWEKSLECCDEGLKIKNFEWLYENKIKALLKLGLVDDAIECYESLPFYMDICGLLIEAGKYSHALEYCIDEWDFEEIIDRIKEVDSSGAGDYYISWIYKITSKSDVRICPECGGKVLPVVYGYPSEDMFEREKRGEIVLGGCCIPPQNLDYFCVDCKTFLDLGCEGLHIDCDEANLYDYIVYKIRELTSKLKKNSMVFVKSLDSLKGELRGFDDKEFDAFISHLINLEFICEPREGYIKLVGFDDFRCIKEYLDDGKFAAPLWLAYPQFSAWTIAWRMGVGENYAMNHPHHSKEYSKLFPAPQYWHFDFSKSPYGPHPLLGYFWSFDGKPKYGEFSGGIEVDDFITLESEGEFTSDTFVFKSIEHALLLSKFLHFDKCSIKDDFESLKTLKLSDCEEKTWQRYEYCVLLNASYFKVMEDENLKRWLLETGGEPLVYRSGDEKNLFGRALMELRDEIRRISKNEDKIDWGYTEYLKHKPWGFKNDG